MTAAIVLFVVALLAELIAVGLIVAESRKAGTLLCEYLARNPDNHENGTRDQGELEQPILDPLLENTNRRWWAVVLILY